MLPSRAELLDAGGIYPVVVPLGWKLIDSDGNDEAIPELPGSPFHRILATGTLFATESERSDQSELMIVRHYSLPGLLTPAILDQYVGILQQVR